MIDVILYFALVALSISGFAFVVITIAINSGRVLPRKPK